MCDGMRKFGSEKIHGEIMQIADRGENSWRLTDYKMKIFEL